MNRLIALLGLVTATGCATSGQQRMPLPTSYEVHVAPDFGPSHQATVVAALDAWTSATDVAFRVVITDEACSGVANEEGPEACFSVEPQSAASVADDCKSATDAIGCTVVSATGQVFAAIDTSLGGPDVYHVALHEIGHALGLQHVPDPSALMYPSISGADAVAPSDIDQYRELRHPL